ncbi:hypothetical protein [Rhodophyticola sp. CCM32]|uniref:hypothetical protein n=1 Tax=Rhodophyticola sp. CCM32 TaxID=2916397 RepID=UPI00143D3E9C|nr:hypothetical protein [Rhodophyticola sp. CCM32]
MAEDAKHAAGSDETGSPHRSGRRLEPVHPGSHGAEADLVDTDKLTDAYGILTIPVFTKKLHSDPLHIK